MLPRPVEGRPAILGSERRVGAPLEKTLDDREVAPDYRVMNSCAFVVLREKGQVKEKPGGLPRGKGFGGEGPRLTSVSLTFAWASRRISTHPSCPFLEDHNSAVDPYLWGDTSKQGGRLQQELAGSRRAQQARRGRVCEARRAGGAAAQPAPTRQLAGLWGTSAVSAASAVAAAPCRRPRYAYRGETTRAPTRGACGGAPQDCAS